MDMDGLSSLEVPDIIINVILQLEYIFKNVI